MQILEALKDKNPLGLLPEGMAPAISRIGIDPMAEAMARYEKMKESIRKNSAND